MGLGSGYRRLLLHWKVDPEIFVLTTAVVGIGGLALYTVSRKHRQAHGKPVLDPKPVADPDRITGYTRQEYSDAADKRKGD